MYAHRRLWKLRRRARDPALIGFIDRDVIGFKNSARRSFKRDSGFRVRALGGHFSGTSLREIALVLKHQKVGRETDVELLLLHVDGLFLKDTRLDGSLIGSPRLLQRAGSWCSQAPNTQRHRR